MGQQRFSKCPNFCSFYFLAIQLQKWFASQDIVNDTTYKKIVATTKGEQSGIISLISEQLFTTLRVPSKAGFML